MKKLNVLTFIVVLMVLLNVTGSTLAQEEINPEIQEARAQMEAITVSMGPENQFDLRAPGLNPELATTTIPIPTDEGCNPIPDIPKNLAANNNLGNEDVPFAARARYCPTDGTLRMKAAPTQSGFPVTSDTLRSYGFLALKDAVGNLIQPVVSFDVTYAPSTQANPQITAVFDAPFDGGKYVPYLEVATKQMPCNNGGSASGSGSFTAGLGSLTLKTHVGCARCVTIIVEKQLKDSDWDQIFTKKYVSYGDIRWSKNDLPEGTYRITFTFCSGRVVERIVDISALNQNPEVQIKGEYGVCLPLIINQRECPTCEDYSVLYEYPIGTFLRRLLFAIVPNTIRAQAQQMTHPNYLVGWLHKNNAWIGYVSQWPGELKKIEIFLISPTNEWLNISTRASEDAQFKVDCADVRWSTQIWIVRVIITLQVPGCPELKCQNDQPVWDPPAVAGEIVTEYPELNQAEVESTLHEVASELGIEYDPEDLETLEIALENIKMETVNRLNK